jgi:hypothetical protein
VESQRASEKGFCDTNYISLFVRDALPSRRRWWDW